MERTDADAACLPVQLFEKGFDVWINNARGVEASRGHLTLDPLVDWDTYWNFTFQDVGEEDIPVLTDFIIKQRADDACSRVTVLTHSTGITEVMAAAAVDPLMTTKVDRVVALAPAFAI